MAFSTSQYHRALGISVATSLLVAFLHGGASSYDGCEHGRKEYFVNQASAKHSDLLPIDNESHVEIECFEVFMTGCPANVKATAHLSFFATNDTSVAPIKTYPVSEPLRGALSSVIGHSPTDGFWRIRFHEGMSAAGEICSGKGSFNATIHVFEKKIEGGIIIDVLPSVVEEKARFTMTIEAPLSDDVVVHEDSLCLSDPLGTVKAGERGVFEFAIGSDREYFRPCVDQGKHQENMWTHNKIQLINSPLPHVIQDVVEDFVNEKTRLFLTIFHPNVTAKTKVKIIDDFEPCTVEATGGTRPVLVHQKEHEGGKTQWGAKIVIATYDMPMTYRICAALDGMNYVLTHVVEHLSELAELYIDCGFKICDKLLSKQ